MNDQESKEEGFGYDEEEEEEVGEEISTEGKEGGTGAGQHTEQSLFSHCDGIF